MFSLIVSPLANDNQQTDCQRQ